MLPHTHFPISPLQTHHSLSHIQVLPTFSPPFPCSGVPPAAAPASGRRVPLLPLSAGVHKKQEACVLRDWAHNHEPARGETSPQRRFFSNSLQKCFKSVPMCLRKTYVVLFPVVIFSAWPLPVSIVMVSVSESRSRGCDSIPALAANLRLLWGRGHAVKIFHQIELQPGVCWLNLYMCVAGE